MWTPRTEQGLTLMELVLSVGLAGLLVAATVPAFDSLFEKQRLKGAAEDVAAGARLARNAAQSTGSPITVSVSAGTAWCVGLSDAGACDCGRSPERGTECRVAGDEYSVGSSRYTGIALRGSDRTVTFPPTLSLPRAVSDSWPLVLESESGLQLAVAMTLLGDVYVCDPAGEADIWDERECPK